MLKVEALALFLAIICAASTVHSDDWDWNGKYQFEYGVKDPHTGDHKSQWEISDGHGGVKGGYTLDEADGTKRYVQYKADKWHGFQAIVKRVGHAIHPKSNEIHSGTKQYHQSNGNGYEPKGQTNGNVLDKGNFQPNLLIHNGWEDQEASSSHNFYGNGWNKVNQDMLATSYVKQKMYY